MSAGQHSTIQVRPAAGRFVVPSILAALGVALGAAPAAAIAAEARSSFGVQCMASAEFSNQHYQYRLEIAVKAGRIERLRWDTYNAFGDNPMRECEMTAAQITEQTRDAQGRIVAKLVAADETGALVLAPNESGEWRIVMTERSPGWCGASGAVIPISIDPRTSRCTLQPYADAPRKP